MASVGAEVEDGIPIFESKALAVTRSQALEKTPIGEETDDEDDLNLYDALEADIANQRAEPAVKDETKVPLAITIQEILDAKSNDEFCQRVLSTQRNSDSRSIETEDGVLRSSAPGSDFTRQIFVPEALSPRLLNLEHHAVISGHPGQKRMYAKLRVGSIGPRWQQMWRRPFGTVANALVTGSNF